MKPYKVLVCGSRDYSDRDSVWRVLDAYRARIGHNMVVISGGATGADTHAQDWARDRHVDHMIFYARWDLEGRAAGSIRNRRMAAKKPKLVLAFSKDFDNSRGTRDMIKVAEKLGIKVKRFS